MTLKTIAPNAHYDMIAKPSVLQKDNDGSFLFRFNVEPEKGIKEGEKKEVQLGWSCFEVRTFLEPTKANLKREVIRSIIDASEEMNLINDYNAHVMGINVNENAVTRYKEYLQLQKDLDEMLTKLLN